jgi:hypothetical protein
VLPITPRYRGNSEPASANAGWTIFRSESKFIINATSWLQASAFTDLGVITESGQPSE